MRLRKRAISSPVAHSPQVGRLGEARPFNHVSSPEALRDEDLHPVTYQRPPVMAEEFLGAPVAPKDDASFIDEKHRVGGSIEELAEVFPFARLFHLGGPVLCGDSTSRI